MATTSEVRAEPERHFLPKQFQLTDWASIKPYFDELLEREIDSPEDLKKWLCDRSELETVAIEAGGWKHINVTQDTANKSYKAAYEKFVSEISPKLESATHRLNKRLLDLPYTKELKDPAYRIMLKRIKRQVELFREENIPLKTEEKLKTKKYGEITGQMTIEVDDEELTLPQAKKKLQSTDRDKRQEVFEKLVECKKEAADALNELFNELIRLRHNIATNAGFDNYRDYKFAALERFDYTTDDCFKFHQAIKEAILPLVDDLKKRRKKSLQLDRLRPWDLSVDVSGQPPLQPFDDSQELVEKTTRCFYEINPFFGKCLEEMRHLEHLDLETRKNKAPGGYNYPLYETGAPFIFMNAAGTVNDLITMVHEGGHAVHSFLTNDLDLLDFKELTSEIAELASMSMELFSLSHWDIFFEDEDALKRAKFKEFERVLTLLPWTATIDKFQHWIYTHPDHTTEERTEAWREICSEFTTDTMDWDGLQDAFDLRWQRQLHLFEVPFYYIEYGIAQLGAIAMWRQYEEDPDKAIEQYMNALKLGYTRPIPEIFKTAGIRFDFSKKYLNELANFVQSQLNEL